ncbi:MAG: hypothetical protein M1587_07260 [Thaumarchaeota archaeon]|nr:hypothetical protein [Nitrososphaerota archaeon]
MPEFQGDPKSWNSTAYLPVSQGSFEEYVNEWHVGAPPAQDDFIRRIASIFGVTIPS